MKILRSFTSMLVMSSVFGVVAGVSIFVGDWVSVAWLVVILSLSLALSATDDRLARAAYWGKWWRLQAFKATYKWMKMSELASSLITSIPTAPTTTRFLQISHKWYDDDCHCELVRWKCLKCGSIEVLSPEPMWKFCPHCGSTLQVTRQEIKLKNPSCYHSWMGDCVVFDWVIENRFGFDEDDDWEKLWTGSGPVISIKDLKKKLTLKRSYHDRLVNYRLRLNPSKPLPLP